MKITSASISPTKKWLIVNGETKIDEVSLVLTDEKRFYEPTHPQYSVLVDALTRMGLLGPVAPPAKGKK
jgi:hypothetical protein